MTDGERPWTNNEFSGGTAGTVVQTGLVNGGVHVHAAPRERVVPRQLPLGPRTFAGRDEEVGRLAGAARAAVERDRTTVVAVNGMPGVGKTALVLHVGHLVAGEFGDGQFFLDLHAHTVGRRPAEPAEALGSLLVADGVAADCLPGGAEERAALWRSRTAGRRVLCVFDNALTHAQVEPLLPAAPGCLVLVTSRRRLSALDAESVEVVSPAENAAVGIFRGFAPGAAPGSAEVGRLVGQLGRLPLALALAAGVFTSHPSWTVADLTAHLDVATHGLGRIRSEDRAVAAAFDLSYQRLPGERQRFFRRLGLHPGTSVDAGAAAALCGVPVDEAAGHLGDLYDDHLLEESAYGRYRMHDLIREYTRSVASQEPPAERERAVGRLLDHYLEAVVTAGRSLGPAALTRGRGVRSDVAGPRAQAPGTEPPPHSRVPEAALKWFGAERDNLQSCLDHCSGTGDNARVVALAAPVAAYFRHVGLWDRVARCCEAEVAAVRRGGSPGSQADALADLGGARSATGQYAEAAEALGGALEIYRLTGDRHGEAGALGQLGVVHQRRGDHAVALRTQDEVLRMYRDLDDPAGRAGAERAAGRVQLLTGHYPEARSLYESALGTYRRIGDRVGEVNALYELGSLGWLTADYETGQRQLHEALGIARAIGYRPGEADTLRHLGTMAHLTGRYAEARALQEEALTIQRAAGNPRGEANSLTELGIALWLGGDYPAADAVLRRGLGIHRELRDRRGEACDLHQLGTVGRLTGRYPAAERSLRQGLALCREIDDRRCEANILNELACSLGLTGRYAEAETVLNEATAVQTAIGDAYGEAGALLLRGAIRLATGDDAAARPLLLRALGMQWELSDRRGEAGTQQHLGVLHLRCGDRVAAVDALTRSLRLHRDIGDRAGEASALTRIGAFHLDAGRPAAAAECCRNAAGIARALGAPLEEARALDGTARALLTAGEPAGAAAARAAAGEIYRRTGAAAGVE